jgi:hypothetical protein
MVAASSPSLNQDGGKVFFRYGLYGTAHVRVCVKRGFSFRSLTVTVHIAVVSRDRE